MIEHIELYLATWRVFRLLRRDDWPLHIAKRLRKLLGVPNGGNVDGIDENNKGLTGEMIQCVNCFSLVSAALYYAYVGRHYAGVNTVFSLSAVCIFLSHANHYMEYVMESTKVNRRQLRQQAKAERTMFGD